MFGGIESPLPILGESPHVAHLAEKRNYEVIGIGKIQSAESLSVGFVGQPLIVFFGCSGRDSAERVFLSRSAHSWLRVVEPKEIPGLQHGANLPTFLHV
jgi:hypothetical protein